MAARNPDYKFISTDSDTINTLLISMYESLSKRTVQAASPERLIIQWVTSVIIQERALLNWTANQNVPSRAVGSNLDALGDLFFGISRPAATYAVSTERFYISAAQSSAVLIPAGTRVTDQSQTLIWETTEDVYIAIGDTYADVAIRCQTAGTSGNGYTAGQIKDIVDVFDYYSSCENLTTSDGGSDEATDDEYYALMRDALDSYSTAGATGSYLYHAKAVSTEIADVAVISHDPGCVTLYVLMDSGELAGSEMKALVLSACNADNVRPLTDYVTVEDAELVTYDVSLTYYLTAGTSASGIAEAVQEAVDEYVVWQSAAFGRDINPSKLAQLLMSSGIKRVEVTSPTFTHLSAGDAETVPQVAKIGTITIVNGGFEDE